MTSSHKSHNGTPYETETDKAPTKDTESQQDTHTMGHR